jgi:hypothetical protein
MGDNYAASCAAQPMDSFHIWLSPDATLLAIIIMSKDLVVPPFFIASDDSSCSICPAYRYKVGSDTYWNAS